ncbi:MAG: (d)CMP kinase [Rikenellaceae bacterium]|nr:(d)CMP kinase [Rikenellaceae bacterium]
MKKIVIAIDGFSSCGKSTFAKRVAARMGYVFIDTGAMYRGVTLYGIEQRLIVDGEIDVQRLVERLKDIKLEFVFNPERQASDLYLNGRNVESEIRTMQVSSMVSRVSSIGEVRRYLTTIQREMGVRKGIVMDGRDIGTTVFPDAELKIFMTAAPQIRAQRRYAELEAKGEKVSIEEIERNLAERDLQDQTRKESPLKQAADAVVLDNSDMTIEDELRWFEQKIASLEL